MAEKRAKHTGGEAPPLTVPKTASDPVAEQVRLGLERVLAAELGGLPEAEALAMAQTGQEPAADTREEYVAVNIVESVVAERAAAFAASHGGCTCPHCVGDITALTLNELPPQYIVAPREALKARRDQYAAAHAAEINEALAGAFLLVKAAPRHGGQA